MIVKKALNKIINKNPVRALVMLAFDGNCKKINELMGLGKRELEMAKLVTRLQALTKDELLDLSEKAGLKKRDEKVFLASTLHGLTHDEISYKYSISLSSVARRKAIALAKVARYLNNNNLVV